MLILLLMMADYKNIRKYQKLCHHKIFLNFFIGCASLPHEAKFLSNKLFVKYANMPHYHVSINIQHLIYFFVDPMHQFILKPFIMAFSFSCIKTLSPRLCYVNFLKILLLFPLSFRFYTIMRCPRLVTFFLCIGNCFFNSMKLFGFYQPNYENLSSFSCARLNYFGFHWSSFMFFFTTYL